MTVEELLCIVEELAEANPEGYVYTKDSKKCASMVNRVYVDELGDLIIEIN